MRGLIGSRRVPSKYPPLFTWMSMHEREMNAPLVIGAGTEHVWCWNCEDEHAVHTGDDDAAAHDPADMQAAQTNRSRTGMGNGVSFLLLRRFLARAVHGQNAIRVGGGESTRTMQSMLPNTPTYPWHWLLWAGFKVFDRYGRSGTSRNERAARATVILALGPPPRYSRQS
eukprot:3593932-Prymnesium_polylepis.1